MVECSCLSVNEYQITNDVFLDFKVIPFGKLEIINSILNL
jgi:hypothetical protein